MQGFPTLKVWNKKFGTGFSDYDGGRTADTIVEFMVKEGKALVAEVASVAAAQGSKPSFLLVGNVDNYPAVKTAAAAKKAHLNFSWISSLSGQTEGSLLYIENGQVSQTLAAGGDVDKFVGDNS